MRITIDKLNGSGEVYLDIMKIICGETSGKSMCDLGCHHAPYTPMLGFSDRTYVDIQDRPLDNTGEIINFIQADIFTFLGFCIKRFDVTIASDVIEHFNLHDGYSLCSKMESVSEKQIIFTPLGKYMVDVNAKSPDAHRSGWLPSMLDDYLAIILPNFHPSLNMGAFFAVKCSDVEKDRILKEINVKYNDNN